MKKLVTICAVAAMIMAVSGIAMAETVIDFDAVAFRPANDGTGDLGTAIEYATQDGMSASTPKGGQKTLYGTNYFDGWSISNIDYIQYTRTAVEGISRPYVNLVITDGAGHYGVISSQGGTQLSTSIVGTVIIDEVEKNIIEERYQFNIAADSGNQAYGFKFYEPSPDSWVGQPTWWGHGTNMTWSDINSWSLLGVGETRPLNSGEITAGYARGPENHGLAIMWGDSASNYLGDTEIYDVTVRANGLDYVAGVPEPATMSLLALSAAALIRRKRA